LSSACIVEVRQPKHKAINVLNFIWIFFFVYFRLQNYEEVRKSPNFLVMKVKRKALIRTFNLPLKLLSFYKAKKIAVFLCFVLT